MSSPVFDSGIGRLFAQKVMNALLFGVSIPDERNFSVRAHVIASAANVIFGLLYIACSFLPWLYAKIGVAIAIPLFYFGFSFLTRERQAQRLRDQLSLKAEFANALMYEFASLPVKLAVLVLNIGTFLFFAFAVERGMNCACGVFLSLSLLHSLRGIDSAINKAMPVNDMEPALSLAVYSAAAYGLSYLNPWIAFAVFTAYPFLSFSGLLPQVVVLCQWASEKICAFFGLFLVPPISFYTAVALLVVSVLHPSTLAFYSLALAACSLSFSRNVLVKMIIYAIISVLGVVYSTVCFVLQKPFTGVAINFMGQVGTVKYLSLCVGGVFSAIFLPLVFVLRRENYRKPRRACNLVINCLLVVCGTVLSIFHILEYMNYLSTIVSASVSSTVIVLLGARAVYPLFYPLESFCGLLLGGWLNFVVTVPCYVSGTVGVLIYNSISRFVQMCVYQHHQCRLCFKDPLRGWQLRLHKLRVLMYIWNFAMFFICALCDIPALPIGGIPVYLPFHPHPMSYFTQKSTYRLAGHRSTSVLPDDENKDDIAIYDTVVKHLFAGSSELRSKIRESNFCDGYLPAGSVQLLMSDKKMIFLINTGANMFRTSHNYLVYALETVETSCHTLERTCLERFVDYIDAQGPASNYVHDMDGPTLVPVSYVDTGRLTPVRQQQPKKVPETLKVGRSRAENHLPANVPQFNDSWLCKYKGCIETTDVTENEYSLSGMFAEQHYRAELVRVFTALLYELVSLQDEAVEAKLSQYGAEYYDSFAVKAETVSRMLAQTFSIDLNLKRQQAVVGLCIYTNFAYISIDSDGVLSRLYKSIPCVLKNPFPPESQKQFQGIVLKAFRSACYYAIQQIMMGDDFATAPTEFAQILNEESGVLLSHPSETRWTDQLANMTCDKMFAIVDGPRAIEQTVQPEKWALYNLPHYYYRSIWSSIQTDLLVFNSTDDERFSVQSLPAALRNLFCEAAGSPFGYPLIEYGQGMI